MSYSQPFDKLENSYKGAALLSELKRRLLLDGLCVSVPEPDVGDDLWIADLNCDDPQFRRCQIKASYSCSHTKASKTYSFNFTPNSPAQFSQRFYYLIGFFDSDIQAGQFHVCCIPSHIFSRLNSDGQIAFNKEGRPMFKFVVKKTTSGYAYSLKLKHSPKAGQIRGSGPPLELDRFFSDGSSLRDLLEFTEAAK